MDQLKEALVCILVREVNIVESFYRGHNIARFPIMVAFVRSDSISWDTALAAQALVAHSLANSGEILHLNVAPETSEDYSCR